MNNKTVLLPAVMVMTFLLTGCWDQVEIEDRGFIIGSGIDLSDDSNNDQTELALTHQFVVPEGIGTPTDSGGDEPAFDNLTSSGTNMFSVSRKMSEQTSKIPFYEHEKVVVISDEVASKPYLFTKVLDIFMRNPEMRRSINVVIADGSAKKVLETKPDSEKVPITYLDSVMENSFANATEVDPVKIGDVHGDSLERVSYVLPRVIPEEKSSKSKGAAVFNGHNQQMVGILDSSETKGMNLITGKAEEGVINIAMNQKNVTFEMEDVDSNIKLDTKDPKNIKAHVTISVDGAISETFGTENLFKERVMKEIEKQVSSEIEKIAEKTIKQSQDKLKADIFGIGKQLQEKHYSLWKQLQDNWDHGANYFSDVTFDVDASTRVDTTGNVNKTKH